jgi:hypothetical protein
MLQIYGITRASLAVGVLGIARAVPAIGVGLLGGSVAGAMDRRRLALASTGSQAAPPGCSPHRPSPISVSCGCCTRWSPCNPP